MTKKKKRERPDNEFSLRYAFDCMPSIDDFVSILLSALDLTFCDMLKKMYLILCGRN